MRKLTFLAFALIGTSNIAMAAVPRDTENDHVITNPAERTEHIEESSIPHHGPVPRDTSAVQVAKTTLKDVPQDTTEQNKATQTLNVSEVRLHPVPSDVTKLVSASPIPVKTGEKASSNLELTSGKHLRYEIRTMFAYEGPNHEDRLNKKIPALLSQSHDDIDEALNNIKSDILDVDSAVMKRDNDQSRDCNDDTVQSFSAHTVLNFDIGSPKIDVDKTVNDTDQTSYFHPSSQTGNRVAIEAAMEKTTETLQTIHHDPKSVIYGSAHVDIPNGATLTLDTRKNGPIVDGSPFSVSYKLDQTYINSTYREHKHDAVETKNYVSEGETKLILNRVNIISFPYSKINGGHTIIFIKPYLVN